MLPPELAVGEASRRRQRADGIDAHDVVVGVVGVLGGIVAFAGVAIVLFAALIGRRRAIGQAVVLRQVHEADRDAAREREPNRLPLGRELGERVEHRARRRVDGIDEQRHRRLHLGRAGELHHLRGVGRPFDEHGVRAHGFQRSHQAAGAAGTVVAHAEDARG